jgi:ATP-dependent DNA helicase RecG
MRRLLQGDVGSGKTVVAACCALMTLESGFSVALMAPTEILAEQHHQLFARWFQPLGLATGLLTASRKTTPGESAGRGSSSAIPPSLWIGTHALLEETFAPENLGLVIIDEQHKFGVAQRQQLVRKGRQPHLLVMTATPIPRTLGLTLYADFDLAVIDTPPAGRGTVRTFLRAPAQMPRVLAFIRQQVQSGRQAYLVYPRVEEGDSASGTKAVTREYERLRDSLPPCRLGLLHGRLPAAEKEAVMAAFRANQVQVLVTTSVVEVGLDVPNATVMVVENADHFGLAQLHQLRGRVGRGPYPSYCILVGAARTPEARARLRVMAQTHDGFRLAEEDLRLRGPGELLGHQQSGLPSFRFGDLATDLGLVQRARRLVEQMP